MEYLAERIIAGIIMALGPLLTVFDLPGNTLLLLTSLMPSVNAGNFAYRCLALKEGKFPGWPCC